MKVAAAVQNAIQCYRVTYKKKRATTQTSLDHFFKRVDRIESSKEPESVPSMSGVSEIAACPPFPIADDPSALLSPTSSPSSSQQLFLPVPTMPAPVCQLLYCTTVLFKVLYCKIKNVFFILCLFFMYYLREKYYKPITVQYYIADCVSWVPRLCWTYKQIGLTNMLSEQNSFICRGLTVNY